MIFILQSMSIAPHQNTSSAATASASPNHTFATANTIARTSLTKRAKTATLSAPHQTSCA